MSFTSLLLEFIADYSVLTTCRLVKVLSSRDSIRSLLSWSIYGIDDLEAKTAEEWQNAQMEADARKRERKVTENTQASEMSQLAEENGDVTMTGSADKQSPQNESEQQEGTAKPISYSRIHLPEIIPRLTTHTVIPTDAEGEAKRQRFSQIATEVLCADVWEIQSKLASDFPGFLRPFWEAALGYGTPDVIREVNVFDDTLSEEEKRRQQEGFAIVQQIYEARHVSRPSSSTSGSPDEDDKRREILRNNFARVNYTLFTQYGPAVFAFIQSLPNVLARILDRIESTAMQDLVLKLVCLEQQGVPGVISWLASERVIPQLYSRLSPYVNATTHTVIYELVKAIVALSSSSAGPGVGGFNPDGGNGQDQNAQAGQLQQQILSSPTDANSQMSTHQVGASGEGTAEEASGSGQRNNQLIRDMVREENVDMLIRYMFDDVTASEDEPSDVILQDQDGERSPHPSMVDEMDTSSSSIAYSFDPYETPRLPSHSSINSSFCNIINVFIELIRKNNSDFAEPHLFHTMRNRLIGMKQRSVESRAAQREGEKDKQGQNGETAPVMQSEEELDEIDREAMETAMEEMSARMGIVHLGSLMEALSDKVDRLQDMIENPKSLVSQPFVTALCVAYHGHLTLHTLAVLVSNSKRTSAANARTIPDYGAVCRAAALLQYVDLKPPAR